MSDDDDLKVELDSDAADDVLTVRLDGELDMAHSAWVDDTLVAAGKHHRRIAVQLDALSFIDSAGIRVLHSLKARSREHNIEVTFEDPSDSVLRALKAAELTELVD